MQTAKAPASVRDQARGVILARLPAANGEWKEPLLGAGAAVVADILSDLEADFAIHLDDDWVACSTVGDLVALVDRKVADKARIALLPANDDMPMIDRARARRARGVSVEIYTPSHAAIDAHMGHRGLVAILLALAGWGVLAGCVGGIVAFALGA